MKKAFSLILVLTLHAQPEPPNRPPGPSDLLVRPNDISQTTKDLLVRPDCTENKICNTRGR